MNVFVYGSLMYPQVWARVVRGAYRGLPAVLHGYRRHALRDAAYPGATPAAGARINGWLWLDVDAADLERLDAFEGAEYRRVAVAVDCAGASEAQVFLFAERERLADRDWDPAAFEREHLEGFAQRHLERDPGGGAR